MRNTGINVSIMTQGKRELALIIEDGDGGLWQNG
jgi:hypothetical protein